VSESIDSTRISRRSIVAGIAALCAHGFARTVHAAETRPLAERLPRPDIDRKFRGNIGKRWPRQKTDAVLQSLWVLEKTPDIGALLAALTV